eukprot:gene266-349_t
MPFVGEKIIYKETCSSTNTLALHLLTTQPPAEGTVVITDCQTHGRGQRNNTWESEPYQNLTFSLILYPTTLTTPQSFLLNMLTTLGICQTLHHYLPHGLYTKWPNDIYYQNKKLGGVLIENIVSQGTIKASVIGIGLNINQTTFRAPYASSLSLICGQNFNLSNLLTQLRQNIQEQYARLAQGQESNLQKDYVKNLYWLHEKRTFQDSQGHFLGTIQGVDDIGRLVIQQAQGPAKYYDCKEVTYIA